MTQVIYKIINVVNNKFYVGSTTNQKVRFRQHRKLLRGNRHHCKHLQAAWNLYGEDKFIFVVVEEVPAKKALCGAEDVWLLEHVGKEHCYNTGRSSAAPWRAAPAHTTPNFGRVMAEQQKANISATLKAYYAEDYANHPRVGKAHTDATKAKISANRKGKIAGADHYRFGKPVSEEVRKKIGDTQRGVQKRARTYTEAGLAKVRANMAAVAAAHPQERKDFAQVMAKFPQEVQQRYGFGAAVYTGALQRITGIVCREHGVFSQYSAQLRKGRGCPSCGGEVRAIKKKAEMLAKWGDAEGREKMLAARK